MIKEKLPLIISFFLIPLLLIIYFSQTFKIHEIKEKYVKEIPILEKENEKLQKESTDIILKYEKLRKIAEKYNFSISNYDILLEDNTNFLDNDKIVLQENVERYKKNERKIKEMRAAIGLINGYQCDANYW